MIELGFPIYFARHGETDWNRQFRIQGQTDTLLNDTGHAQSALMARRLKEHLSEARIGRFIVSPLTRARQSMDYVAREFGLDDTRIEIEPAMIELSFGVWEGHTFEEFHASPDNPKTPLERFHWRPKGGESYADGIERVRRWIGRLDGPTIIVAHGAIGRSLIGLVASLEPAAVPAAKTPQGRFCTLLDGTIVWSEGEPVTATAAGP